MFRTNVWQKSMTQEYQQPQFGIHENEHVLGCCPKECAQFAQACIIELSGLK